jgi:hypothetical protein
MTVFCADLLVLFVGSFYDLKNKIKQRFPSPTDHPSPQS